MARKRSDPAVTASEGRGSWIPRAFFVGFLAAAVFLGWKIVQNRLESPSAFRRLSPDGKQAVVFYSRGRADQREVWLFRDTPDGSGAPEFLLKMDRQMLLGGRIHWTADSRGLLLYTEGAAAPRIIPLTTRNPASEPGAEVAAGGSIASREPRLQFWESTRWEKAMRTGVEKGEIEIEK